LEQGDLGNYKADLHQIFRDGGRVGADVIWYWFPDWSRDVAKATNFTREIGDTPSFLGLAFHNG